MARALTLVAIIGIGLLIKRIGWVTTAHFPIFSNLVLWITLPGALLTAFSEQTFDPSLLLLTGLAILFNAAQQVLGYLMAARHGRQAQAFAVLNSGSYNIGVFTTPYLAGIIGPHAMLYTTMFDIGGAVSTTGLGVGWATALAQPVSRDRFGRIVRGLANPVLITYAVLLGLMVTGARLPELVAGFAATVGAANPFLAMLMIGIGLEIRLPRRKLWLGMRFLAVRLVFALLVAVGVWWWLPMPQEVRVIIATLAFSPMASMLPAFSSRLGLDAELSAFMTSATILVGIVAMPAVLLLLG